MRQIVTSAKLAFVATVCEDGSPNLSPKGSVRVYDDDHLVFMNMASPRTAENLRHNPRVEVNVIDFLLRRGYRFKGTAEIREEGDPVYDWSRQWVLNPRRSHLPVPRGRTHSGGPGAAGGLSRVHVRARERGRPEA
ncbi:pyridoxamine 5'-phosphate oxidase family protein [Peterkaempfera sp. SMS 1(5)a]|uniref:pyridoxamine 5'-phosphate oxidase family protein n=1 Tax=Peterkaempfera podocarpi TaxID=3232308 RepID=UPI00366EA16A